MNQLLEYVDRLKAFVIEVLGKIESSPYYDRILNRFESLESKHQKWAIAGGRLVILVGLGYFLVSPFFAVWGQKSQLDEQRKLLVEMKLFNEAVETQPRPAAPPREWQPMAAMSVEEATNSLKAYMSSLGFPDGSYQLMASSNAHIQLDVPEINLRQAQALLYQIDGWYPQVSSQVLALKVHPSDAQKLVMSATLAHNEGAAPGAPLRGTAPPPPTQDRRTQPRNLETPESDSYSTPPPPNFDQVVPSERQDNPILDEYAPNIDPNEGSDLPNFDALDENDALDSLPPPPEEFSGDIE